MKLKVGEGAEGDTKIIYYSQWDSTIKYVTGWVP